MSNNLIVLPKKLPEPENNFVQFCNKVTNDAISKPNIQRRV